MSRPATPTLGQVLRQAVVRSRLCSLGLSPHQWKTIRALAACRTPALGGQLFQCTHCGRDHFVAHSCRNRHCPQCQGAQALDWLERQEAALLPIPYFHLVFTLPHQLNPLIRQNRTGLFTLLFKAVSQTLLQFGEGRLQAQIGVTAVLHTWSQNLLDHYHLHCIVTGGGVSLDGQQWNRSQAHYLFPIAALSQMFRGKFLAGLKQLSDGGKLEFHGDLQGLAQPAAFAGLLREIAQPKWVVYAKRPFGGPKQVLAYLSRYTHRVAISNRRLLCADEDHVTFTYKDYADQSRIKTMKLEVAEFVRRFGLHILPERFVKIRHYGLLGNRQRQQRLEAVRPLLERAAPSPASGSVIPKPTLPEPAVSCPFCQGRNLILIGEVPPRRALVSIPILNSS